jgi:cytochrome P450
MDAVMGATMFGMILFIVFCLARNNRRQILGLKGPRGTPILGNLRELLRPNFHRVLSDWAEQYGGVYGIRILGLDGVVVSDPDAVAEILGRERTSSEIPKHQLSYKQLNLLWGKVDQHSIFTGQNTERWRSTRKAVSPCFSSANVRHASAPHRFLQIVNEHI